MVTHLHPSGALRTCARLVLPLLLMMSFATPGKAAPSSGHQLGLSGLLTLTRIHISTAGSISGRILFENQQQVDHNSQSPSTEPCKTVNGDDGVCSALSDCHPSLDLRSQRPVICGWKAPGSSEPKVCCSSPKSMTTLPPAYNSEEEKDSSSEENTVATDAVIPATSVPELLGGKVDPAAYDANASSVSPTDDRLSELPAPSTSEGSDVASDTPADETQHRVPDFLACGCVRRKKGESCPERTLPDIEEIFFSIQVFGGQPVETPGEYPWMALLGVRRENETKWICGGTLISDRHVLTAAHCIPANNRIDVVRLGEHDLSRTDEGAETAEFTVRKISVHPEYRRPVIYNDIAILTLDGKIEFSEFIRPACLPPGGVPMEVYRPPQKIYIMGWGISGPDAQRTDIMNYADVSIHERDGCNSLYSNLTILKQRQYPDGITDRLICALGSGEQDTCQGDSGGPLVRLDFNSRSKTSQYTVTGVVSTGQQNACGDSSLPGLYTSVEAYLDWIRLELMAS